MQGEILFALVFVLGMFAGVVVIFAAMRQRSQQQEMWHREKMAMIERGLTPTREPNFVHDLITRSSPRPASSTRSMSLGIVIVAVGLGLMTIISVAGGAPEVGIGVGGAIAIIGIAFIVNSVVNRHNAPPPDMPPAPRQDNLG